MKTVNAALTVLIAGALLAACEAGTNGSSSGDVAANDEAAGTETPDAAPAPEAQSLPGHRFGAFIETPELDEARVTATGSGLEYIVLESGDGAGSSPGARDCVTVDYEGRLADTGETFDSSYERGQPATFPVGGLIRGWTEALQLMVPGDEWVLLIPADLAYGDNPRPGGLIKPGDDLAFRLEMHEVVDLPALDADDWEALPDWSAEEGDFQTTESGLKYVVLNAAPEEARSPVASDRVVVHYEGRFAASGETFDASFRRCEPAMFGVGQVIPGWTEMLQLMGEGEEVVVWIPSDLAYGRRGKGPIGPDEDLVFHVKLLDILSVN
jgi:FKBP-type peptidyl-prolyl cis-trans isomerase